MQNMKLLVVGSINMDIFTYVENLPKPGETLNSEQVKFGSGGKGANQAVAASLSGAEVYILGAVGNDAFQGTLLQSLKENNVNLNYVIEKNTNSGLALITVDQNGENHIVLSEGANGLIKNKDVDKVLEQSILPAAVLVQNEITWETTRYVMEKAKKLNIAVYYNAAPAKKISDKVFGLMDVLILNELEATTLTGTIIEVDEDAKHALNQLINKGVKEVIIT
ncbi:MAG: ribokinase, partial [Mesobacillus sp.]|uniref:ribokinase n=1 Tax=Mesobacillus sp. TaxID=2675271 RepID=UPI003C48574D